MKWYLVYCKAHELVRAQKNLKVQDVESYYPLLNLKKQRYGKIEYKLVPLFKNYLFVKFDYFKNSFISIESTRGISYIVRCAGKPCALSQDLIDYFKDKQISKHSEITTGSKVLIKNGTYQDIEAIYQHPSDETRSYLLIDLLNKQTKVQIENKDIRLID